MLDSELERFYHGFVLGLIVKLRDRYVITSNRESVFGRYDVILELRKQNYAASFIEKGFPKEHFREYGFAFLGKKY